VIPAVLLLLLPFFTDNATAGAMAADMTTFFFHDGESGNGCLFTRVDLRGGVFLGPGFMVISLLVMLSR